MKSHVLESIQCIPKWIRSDLDLFCPSILEPAYLCCGYKILESVVVGIQKTRSTDNVKMKKNAL